MVERGNIHRLTPGEQIAIHELAEALPRPHLAKLCESISDIGQQKPGKAIEIAGKLTLIDGVTRLLICQKLKIDYLYEVSNIDCDPDEWVLRNLSLTRRRELNDSQQALLAAKRAQRLAPAAKIRMKAGTKSEGVETGRSYQLAAKYLNVNPSRVRAAQQIIAAEDICQLVNDYGLALSKAAKIHSLPAVRRAAAIEAVRRGDKAALADTLSNGEAIATDIRNAAIPQHLASAFAAGNRLAKLRDAANQIAEGLESIEPTAATRLVAGADGPQRFRELAKLLDASRPVAVCPICQGAACDQCNESGWLSYEELQLLDKKAYGALSPTQNEMHSTNRAHRK